MIRTTYNLDLWIPQDADYDWDTKLNNALNELDYKLSYGAVDFKVSATTLKGKQITNNAQENGSTLFYNNGTFQYKNIYSSPLPIYFMRDTGTVNTIQCSIGIDTYRPDCVFLIKVKNTNTGATTIQINSLQTIELVTKYNTALIAGNIVVNGFILVNYNSTLNKMQMLSPVHNTDYDWINYFNNNAGSGSVYYKIKAINPDLSLSGYSNTITFTL